MRIPRVLLPSLQEVSLAGTFFYAEVYLSMSYVYISGKITGNENYRSQFEKREKELKALGYIPVNPVRIYDRLKCRIGREPSRDEIMAEDIRELKKCEYINFLGNWKESEGAREEYKVAQENNITTLNFRLVPRGWN